ncbi:MAG: putative sigma-54 modulation protein [Patescibacteria group bacterium]|jgi:putative sigma-54 modulation protein|nr:putative sigma-54 modulation protein [Patescibacteria group bacterium]
MKIKIRSKNFDLTPAIDEYVSKKISSLEKFLDVKGEVLCEVEIGRTTKHHNSGDIFKAEINIAQPGGKQIYVVAEEVDLYTAIDVVRDEAERAIVSRKNKYKTLFRKGASRVKDLLKRLDFRKRQ